MFLTPELNWAVILQSALYVSAWSFPVARGALLGISGLFWCGQARIVEANGGESRLCDLSSRVSCGATLTSAQAYLFSWFGLVPVGHVLDVSNTTIGIVFYSLLALVDHPWVARFFWNFALQRLVDLGTLLTVPVSLYLASQLVALRTLCLICVMIYMLNANIIAHRILRRVFP